MIDKASKQVKHKRPTHKEAILIAEKAKGATHAEAYAKAYSSTASKATAVSNTQKILSKPHVKSAMEKALEKHNITIDRALSPISKGLDHKNQYGNDDMKVQLQASDRALKLLGVDNSGQQGSIHFHLHEAKQRYNI